MKILIACLVVAVGGTVGCRSGGSSADATPASFTVGAFGVTISAGAMRLGHQAGVDLGDVVRNAVKKIEASLAARGPADITVGVGLGIPEIGVTGFTNPSSGAVVVNIQESSPIGLRASMTRWVPQALAHELFESKRILEGPGFGGTLGAWLVADGGADNFAHALDPSVGVFPWDKRLTAAQERAMWAKVRPLLSTPLPLSDFGKWFFGSPDVPRNTGYTIGYHVVGSYLAHHPGIRPADVATTPAATVLDTSGYSPPG